MSFKNKRYDEILDETIKSRIFDKKYFIDRYGDVLNKKDNLLMQFLNFGIKRGYSPSAAFSSEEYRIMHPFLQSDEEAFLHYLFEGRKQNHPGTIDYSKFRKALQITTRIGCSVNCKYCAQKTLIKAYNKISLHRDMLYSDFVTIMDKVPKDVDVDFTGFCEPWANADCSKMICYAHQGGHRIIVSTTLKGVTKEDIESIRNIPFEMFTIHLPGRDNDMNVTVDRQYIQCLDFIFKSKVANVSLRCHGEKLNERIWKYLEAKGKHVLTLGLVSRAGNVSDHPRISEYDVVDAFNEGGKTCGLCATSPSLENNVLLPNGDVALCCMDYGLKHIIGNLLTSSYEDLMNSAKKQHIKFSIQNGSCDDVICKKCVRLEFVSEKLGKTIYNKLSS